LLASLFAVVPESWGPPELPLLDEDDEPLLLVDPPLDPDDPPLLPEPEPPPPELLADVDPELPAAVDPELPEAPAPFELGAPELAPPSPWD